MARKIGLWIDHTKAVVVSLDKDQVSTETVESGVEKRIRVQGGSRSVAPYGPQEATYEPRRDRKHDQHLREFYDRVVAGTSGADAVFIMGPGEAKTELRKRMGESFGAPDRVNTFAVDKLTEAQIVEKVKQHYGYPTRETVR